MILVDARRLTGPSHLSRAPIVIAEVTLEPGEAIADARAAYAAELSRMRLALGLPGGVALLTRPHVGGAVFGYEAPVDVMLACAEMSEWAGMSAAERMAGRPALDLEPKRAEIALMLDEQRSPRLVALVAEAGVRGVAVLWDDELVTFGMGRGSVTFPITPRAGLPEARAVPWSSLARVPIALITGTNGKTTTSRLLAKIAAAAGLRAGVASTGGMMLAGETLAEGDWTGPAAARTILRRDDVDLAVLETARGGILRRGLAVDTCDVAVITNVRDDHLGLYGIDDLSAMTAVKGLVAQVVRPGGAAVLAASDVRLVALAQTLACEVIFFADLDAPPAEGDPATKVLSEARARGARSVLARDGDIVVRSGEAEAVLMRVDEAPITFGGAARYNVQNVLAAIGAALSLGLPEAAIAAAVRAFSQHDNPGRGQLSEHGGVRVLRDFGHNADGVRAVMQLVSRLREPPHPRGRLTVVTGSPGDRTDRELACVAAAICEAAPDRVLVRELEHYLRGRSLGEVPAVLRRELLACGLDASAFGVTASEVSALREALADGAPGDFVAVLVHVEEDETAAFLAAYVPPARPDA